MRRQLLASTTAVALLFGMASAHADMEAAKAFLDLLAGPSGAAMLKDKGMERPAP